MLCAALLLITVFSPLLQPYLLNPGVIPFSSIAAYSLALICTLLIANERSYLSVIPLLLLLLLLVINVSAYEPLVIIILCALLLSAIVSAGYFVSYRNLFIAFYLAAAFVWSLLALYVWAGYSDGKAIHFGLWALTTTMQMKPGGPFANGNVLAILDACAWLMASYFAIRSGKVVWWCVAWFFLLCVMIAQAWGAWIAVIPFVLWMLAYYLWQRNYRVVVYLGVSVLLAWSAGQAIHRHVMADTADIQQIRIQQTQEHGIEQRMLIWRSALAMWEDNPWLGVGIGQMSAHYLTYQSQVLETQPKSSSSAEQVAINSAHNSLLQLMAEAGVVGVLLWLLITATLLRLSWCYRQRVHHLSWVFLACAWLLWIQGMGNITMSRPYPIFMFALFLALASAPLWRLQARTSRRPYAVWVLTHGQRMGLLLLLCAMIGMLSWQAVEKTQRWLDFERLFFSSTVIPVQERSKVTAQLMEEPSILPHLISSMISDRLLYPQLHASTLPLEPWLHQALSIMQTPLLLEQQFYMHALQQRWQQACDVGKILAPMAIEADNRLAFHQACQARMPENFSFSVNRVRMSKSN